MANQLQQAHPGVDIFAMSLQVIRKLFNSLGQKSYLYLY